MDNRHDMLLIAVCTLVTVLTRFLPFWIFRSKEKTPAFVTRLGTVLPHAIMGMLVVYCMKEVSLLSPPYGLPELLGCGVVAALHLWKRNSLLSIAGGTIFYMLMVQFIF